MAGLAVLFLLVVIAFALGPALAAFHGHPVLRNLLVAYGCKLLIQTPALVPMAMLKQSLDIKEDQPYARSALGWSYYGLKKYDDAEQEFNHAIDLKSDYADAYYGLGRALQSQDKKDDARAAYQKAIDNGSTSAKDALDQLK